MIKAVIFDLDGTLLHTSPEYLEKLLKKCCADAGIEPTKESVEELWFGPKRREFIEGHGIDPQKFWELFVKYDTIDERTKHLIPYGDCSVLKRLAEQGRKLGIMTNAYFHMAHHQIDLLHGQGINFDAIVVPWDEKHNMLLRPKPHPAGILECIKILEINKNEALFVGNGPDDTEAALAAGVRSVHIDRGEHLIPVDATFSIKSLEELPEIIGIIEAGK